MHCSCQQQIIGLDQSLCCSTGWSQAQEGDLRTCDKVFNSIMLTTCTVVTSKHPVKSNGTLHKTLMWRQMYFFYRSISLLFSQLPLLYVFIYCLHTASFPLGPPICHQLRLLADLWHNHRVSQNTGLKAFLLISMFVHCIFWTACLPAQRCYFGALGSDNQCIEMCSKYRRRVQHLSSIHLCCSLYRCEIHTLRVSPLGVYDEDSQWMIQVNRLQKLIDRLEQKVASFLSTFLSPLLSFLLFSSTCNVFFFLTFICLLSP